MIKKILFTIFSFLVIFNVYAENITCSDKYDAILSINNTSINVGDTAELSVIDTDNLKYSVDYSIVSGAKTASVKVNNNKAIIKGVSGGTLVIKASIIFMDSSGNGKGTCNKDISITVTSSDVTLKTLTTDQFDMTNMFKSNIYEYTINLPYEIENVNIIAVPTDSNAEVSGDGSRYLNEGEQSFMVIVRNNGEKSTYKINIIRSVASNDATLKNIVIDGFVLTPLFNKDIDSYKLKVGENVNQITVKAEPNDPFALLSGSGTFELTTGTNHLILKVTSQSGIEQTYNVNIEKTRGTSLLKSLKVSKHKLDKKFNRNIFIYNLTTYEDVNSLKIVAQASEGDKVEIIGNENLKYGRNSIYIKVYSKDKTSSVYKLNVFKVNPKTLLNGLDSNSNTLSNVLLIIFIVSIIITAGLITIFIKRNYLKQKKTNNIKKGKKR